MKLTRFTTLMVVSAVLITLATGCKKKAGFVTPLPAGMTKAPQDARPDTAMTLPPTDTTMGAKESGLTSEQIANAGGVKQTGPGAFDGWPENREILKGSTVHFDFDSSNVKAAERPKVTAVADYLRSNPTHAVKIEGHCDERGTEEYNRSLGERRALALREELIRLGADSNRVVTITYGEDRPAVQGHDEAAFRENRRGEFVVLTPP